MGLNNSCFIDVTYFLDTNGVEITGQTPTVNIYDPSNNKSSGVVAEIGNGLYNCSVLPGSNGAYKTRWRLSYGGSEYGVTHLFFVGMGQVGKKKQ